MRPSKRALCVARELRIQDTAMTADAEDEAAGQVLGLGAQR